MGGRVVVLLSADGGQGTIRALSHLILHTFLQEQLIIRSFIHSFLELSDPPTQLLREELVLEPDLSDFIVSQSFCLNDVGMKVTIL